MGMLAAELIAAVGAGMTVKFFGLWFKNVYNFTPAGLSAMQATSPFAIAIAVQALQRTAKACPLGPVPVVLAFWVAGVAMLLAMLHISDWRLLVVLHLLRTSLINAKEPISRAILADFIPSSQRGRRHSVACCATDTVTARPSHGQPLSTSSPLAAGFLSFVLCLANPRRPTREATSNSARLLDVRVSRVLCATPFGQVQLCSHSETHQTFDMPFAPFQESSHKAQK